MKIAVYGATGMIGSRVVTEALTRGHEVTGITRTGGDVPAAVRAIQGDAGDAALAKRIASEVDVVVSAVGPDRAGGDLRAHLDLLRRVAETVGDTRLVVVGGAGSLLVKGRRVVDDPDYPEIWRPEALMMADAWEYFHDLGGAVDWTYLCPAVLIEPGERTGEYKVGTDSPAGDRISAEDYAVAMLDEIEIPAHRGQRFTVAN